MDEDGFKLGLDNLREAYFEDFTVELVAGYGARISHVEFINLDQWDESLVGKVEDFISDVALELAWNLVFNYFYNFYW
jgi:nitrogen regulatory protein PII